MHHNFSENYALARERFISLSARLGAQQNAYVHGLKGRDGETLALDISALGKKSARTLLVTSACHGVEGYCGSGIQIAALSSPGLVQRAQELGVQLIMAHALNPYGFSFGRRVNEDNVDLNRNFHDFSKPLPINSAYGPLHQLLLPASWPPPAANEQALMTEFAARGMPYMQGAITGGQHTHSDGLHYSGQAPVWSHLKTRQLLREYCSHARHVAWIDLHSGLGPAGVGERMFSPCYTLENADLDGPMWDRACEWWGGNGATPLTRVGKDSASSDKIQGSINASALWECPQANLTKLTLEFGTQPPLVVLQAMRAEQWLQLHPEAPVAQAAQIEQQMREAFFVDSPEWKQAVLRQGVEAIGQALEGLARQP